MASVVRTRGGADSCALAQVQAQVQVQASAEAVASTESVASAELASGAGALGTNKKGHIMWPWVPLVPGTRGLLLNMNG